MCSQAGPKGQTFMNHTKPEDTGRERLLYAERAVHVILYVFDHTAMRTNTVRSKPNFKSVFTLYSEPLLLWTKAGERITKLNWLKHNKSSLETDFLKAPIKQKSLDKIFSKQWSCTFKAFMFLQFWQPERWNITHLRFTSIKEKEHLCKLKAGNLWSSAELPINTFSFTTTPYPNFLTHSFGIRTYVSTGKLQVKTLHETFKAWHSFIVLSSPFCQGGKQNIWVSYLLMKTQTVPDSLFLCPFLELEKKEMVQ